MVFYFVGMISSGSLQGQGHDPGMVHPGMVSRDQHGVMAAVVPQHIIQSHPEVLKGKGH